MAETLLSPRVLERHNCQHELINVRLTFHDRLVMSTLPVTAPCFFQLDETHDHPFQADAIVSMCRMDACKIASTKPQVVT